MVHVPHQVPQDKRLRTREREGEGGREGGGGRGREREGEGGREREREGVFDMRAMVYTTDSPHELVCLSSCGGIRDNVDNSLSHISNLHTHTIDVCVCCAGVCDD